MESTVVMTTRKLYDSEAEGGVNDSVTVFEAKLIIQSYTCIITYLFKFGYDVQHCIFDKLGKLVRK